MSVWKPGWMFCDGVYRKLEVGQVFRYMLPIERSWSYLDLRVISTSECGEVVLRPVRKGVSGASIFEEDKIQPIQSYADLDDVFPDVPFQKGEAGNCPFKKQDRKAPTDQQADLRCHEAWSLWEGMWISE